jgi:uncharacterized membrane protein YedE/YeeE
MRAIAALVCGIAFGVGLALGGMTNPAKVLAFLDLAGAWDATLALVMAGALAVNAPVYWMTRRRTRPLLAGAFALPASRELDARLLGGAALFGVGWGLAGLCPGPALADLARGDLRVAVFVAAMVAGMLLQRKIAAPAAADAIGARPDSPSALRAA